ncbi:hypothetical protein ACWFRF_14315 [Nocardia sp. NPDC055165]
MIPIENARVLADSVAAEFVKIDQAVSTDGLCPHEVKLRRAILDAKMALSKADPHEFLYRVGQAVQVFAKADDGVVHLFWGTDPTGAPLDLAAIPLAYLHSDDDADDDDDAFGAGWLPAVPDTVPESWTQ